jgi:hypothetical protein
MKDPHTATLGGPSRNFTTARVPGCSVTPMVLSSAPSLVMSRWQAPRRRHKWLCRKRNPGFMRWLQHSLILEGC